MDMLNDMFERQAALNRRIGYDTKGIRRTFDAQNAGKWLNYKRQDGECSMKAKDETDNKATTLDERS